MSVERTCPTCMTDKAQRICDILEQSPAAKALTGLPTSYLPPKVPWAYLQGFLLGVPVYVGILLTIGSPQGSEAEMSVAEITSSAGLLGVWVGYGRLKTKTYTEKLAEWKATIASKFLCRKCSHAFEG
ncbi:MAG: hypothetical protein AABZ24_02140 [Nitrospirota bacterium]